MSKRILLIGFCAVVFAAAAIMFVIALGFDAKTVETNMPGSRFFPFVTLTLIGVFSLAIIVQNLVRGEQAQDVKPEIPEDDVPPEAPSDPSKLVMSKSEILRVAIITVAAFVAYALWKPLGFLPIAGFFIVAVGITLKVRTVWGYLIMAAIAAALFFILTSLGIPLD